MIDRKLPSAVIPADFRRESSAYVMISVLKLLFAAAICVLLFSGESGLAQEVLGSALPSNDNPGRNEMITVDIFMDMNGSGELLGSFTGSLKWDPVVLDYNSNSGVQAGFTGAINRDSTSNGILSFNGANAQGAEGSFQILSLALTAVGQNGSVSVLDLEFSAMAAAMNFMNLLPILTVRDTVVMVRETPLSVKGPSPRPTNFALHQNYPNPFNLETRIQFEVSEPRELSITIFNLLGKKLRTLLRGFVQPGIYEISWDGRDDNRQIVASGIYIYEMRIEDAVYFGKAIVLK